MRDYLFLYVNGEPLHIRGRAAFMTLAGFLRSERHLTGTKIVCDEGDCGACTVLIGRPENARLTYRPVNACILHVYQVDGAHVVTVEGLTSNGELSPIHQSMIVHHGAQCGFCTPGFVTALTGLFETDGPISARDVGEGLTGNLCRCTGYDPITKAAMAVDPDRIRRLNELYPPAEMLAAFNRHAGIPVQIKALRHAVSSPAGGDHAQQIASSHPTDGAAPAHVPSPISRESTRQDADSAQIGGAEQIFASPVSLDAAVRFLAEHDDTLIVQGGTDVGVWCNKRDFIPRSVLSLRQIPSLRSVELRDGRLEIGGSATLHALEPVARTHVPALFDILRLFGSPQIRHAGTLAGNIANASPIADTLPFLYVMEADVELTGPDGSRLIGIRELFKGYKDLDLARGELITRISIPLPSEGETLRLYKVSKRKDLDISSFTAALRMTRADGRIESIRIAYGGVGPVVLRLPRTEAWLAGRPFTLETLTKAGAIARREIAPITDVRGSRDFRLTLAASILQKFYHECSADAVGVL